MTSAPRLAALRARVAALESSGPALGVLPFGDARVDGRFAGGGLPLGRWHELSGAGMEAETCAAPAAFAARLAARAGRGTVVWAARRADLHAPGIEQLGLAPGRLLFVAARTEAEILAAMEDALRAGGVDAVVGEVEDVDLVAGRRLQLACEQGRATGFVLRRRPFGVRAGPAAEDGPSAATTRWTVAPAPSEPAPGEPGLGRERWKVSLERCRGGRPGSWIMEADDGADPVRVVAELVDRQLPAAHDDRRRAAG